MEKIDKLDIKNFYKCNNIWDMSTDKNKHLADIFYKELVEGNRITFIYQDNDEYIGEVSLVFDMDDSDYTVKDKRIYVSRFLVKKGYRSSGIGTKLMNYIVDYAKIHGYLEMSVGVDLDNYITIRFYVKNGFDKIIFVGEDEHAKYMKLLKKL